MNKTPISETVKEKIDAKNNALLKQLSEANEEDKGAIVSQIIRDNMHLIFKCVESTNYKCFKICAFEDAVSLYKTLLYSRILDGEVKDWADDIMSVCSAVTQKVNETLIAEYSNAGIKMSYSTYYRRLKNKQKTRVVEYENYMSASMDDYDYLKVEMTETIHNLIKLANLKDTDIELLLARIDNGMSFDDIAAQSGKNCDTVRVSFYRILARLRKVADEFYPDLEEYLYI